MAARKKKSRKKTSRRKKATTRASSNGATRGYNRRTPEEIIADLKAKIRDVEQRAAAKELKQSPSVRKSLTIVRAMDKVIDAAAEEKNTALQHVLADSRQPLADYIESQGLKLPKPRRPRGRRPAGV